MPYVRYSTRGTVEGSIKHEAKQSALLVSRSYPGAVYIFCIYSGQTKLKGARVVTNYVSQIWNGKIYMSHPYYIMIKFDSLYAMYLVLLTHKILHKASKNSNPIQFALCYTY